MILVIGLVPLMLAYSMATKETRVSISQIQAINHAANLVFMATVGDCTSGFARARAQRCRSGRLRAVFACAAARRQAAIAAWSPESKISGTRIPRNSCGRV